MMLSAPLQILPFPSLCKFSVLKITFFTLTEKFYFKNAAFNSLVAMPHHESAAVNICSDFTVNTNLKSVSYF